MRYLMKQKLFCWGDDFHIKNEAGEDVFFVDGRAFSIGNKLSFQDLQRQRTRLHPPEAAFVGADLRDHARTANCLPW